MASLQDDPAPSARERCASDSFADAHGGPTTNRIHDLVLAVGLGCVALLLYSGTPFDRVLGADGAGLSNWTARPDSAYAGYHNALYLPAARLLHWMLPDGVLAPASDPLQVGKALSRLGGAMAISFTYGCCRLIGSSRLAAALAALFVVITPAPWLFGVAIEVHAQHFAVVAFAVWATLSAPWSRPAIAMACAAAVLFLACLSHQTAPLFGPAWILLVQFARRRVANSFSLWALFGIGVVLLAAVIASHMAIEWRHGKGFESDLEGLASTVMSWRRPFTWAFAWEALITPFALLLPLLVLATTRPHVDGLLRAVVLCVYVPFVGCILWWGIAEDGGYLLAPTVFGAMALSAWWSTWKASMQMAVVAFVLVAQGLAGFSLVDSLCAEGFRLGDRETVIRQHLGDRGLVVSCNDNAPTIDLWLPGVAEINLGPATTHNASPAQLEAGLRVFLDGLESHDRFLLDRSWIRRPDHTSTFLGAVALLESEVQARYHVQEIEHPSWPCWLCTKH